VFFVKLNFKIFNFRACELCGALVSTLDCEGVGLGFESHLILFCICHMITCERNGCIRLSHILLIYFSLFLSLGVGVGVEMSARKEFVL